MSGGRELLQSFLQANKDIEIFEVILPNLSGGLRGKWVTRDKVEKLLSGGIKLPLSTLAFDVWGRDPEAWVFESGDSDGICIPEMGTLVRLPWAEKPTAQVIVSLQQANGGRCDFDTRQLLHKLQSRLGALGLTPVLASEMEFHLFRDQQDARGIPVHTQQDRVGGALSAGQTYGIEAMDAMANLMHDIRDAAVEQRLPVDTLIKESGASQYEINLHHCANALQAADQTIMLKRLIRAVSAQQGYRATFMAKPFGNLAGNGMHVHCSMLDESGGNVFDDGAEKGTPLLRYALAGCLQLMADSMLLFAPNMNSYRRFQRGSHAPMAPTWGYENRTVALRVPADAPAARRLEHRVAGADAQPHLIYAAILAGMLHGIENKLEAPLPLEGNAYEQVPPSLPAYWYAALARFSESALIAEYLGEEFQRVYTLIKQQEIDEFSRHVTPLEYDACL